MVLQKKRPNTINIRLLNFSCKHPIIVYIVVRVTDCKSEGAGSIPDGIANVIALMSRLPKNHKRFFARTFYGSSERVLEFYLEPIKVPAER